MFNALRMPVVYYQTSRGHEDRLVIQMAVDYMVVADVQR